MLFRYTFIFFVLSSFEANAAPNDWALLKHVLGHTEKYFNFTKVAIFIGNSVSHETRKEVHSYFNEAEHMRAQYIFTDEAVVNIWDILRHHVKHDVLNILFCDSAKDLIWGIMDGILRKLRVTKVIVVLRGEQYRYITLEQVIQKLWQFQFMDTIVLYHERIYSYKPYPKVQIYEVERNSTQNYFPAIERDLQGYNISVHIQNDIPRIFFITDKHGQQQVKGFGFQIFQHFMKRLNATFHIANLNRNRTILDSVNISTVIESIRTLETEITPHPYTTIDFRKGIIGYPIFKVKNCLIVPVRNEIERFMYLLRPFAWSSWLLIIVCIVYLAVLLMYLSPALREIRSIPVRFSRSLLESLAQILFLPSIFRIYDPTFVYFFINILLAMLGFFITTWYCNLLGSFLTTFLVGEQIDTYEQWIAAQLPVMAKGHEAVMLFWFVPSHLKPKSKHLMLSVNASVHVAHLLSFNTSFAYPETEERWTFLALQQQYANKPIFRYSKICFGSPTIGYPMRLDSHLEHAMTQFIMDVQMSGLDHYWLTSDFKHALKAGYVRLIDNVLPLKALDLDSLRVAWCVVISGWIISALAFICECKRLRVPFNIRWFKMHKFSSSTKSS